LTDRLRAIGGVGALAFWLAVTAAWWALALWPLPGETPAWLARTRAVCFNATETGLPDASGWLLLAGQPIGMLVVLLVIWGRSVRAGLGTLAAARAGRAVLAATVAAVVVGLGAAGARVVSASAPADSSPLGIGIPPDTYPRLDRDAPSLGLVDQHGQPLDLARLQGRPALVTFAFGGCKTVCPLVVRDALEAQRRQRERARPLEGSGDPRVPQVVVVTLDPWRDTPARLDHIATHWKLDEGGFVLSGGVDAVNDVLDAWNVARERDESSGDLAHPPLVYVLDASGRIAYAASGGVETLVALLDRS
jgi:protein SCO1/2